MIKALSIYYQKPIAALGAVLIYLQIVTPSILHASQPVGYFPIQLFKFPDSPGRLFSDTRSADAGERLPILEGNEFGGGPGQPEMSSFQSANGDNLVDLFSGDFSYNIPLMDVGGYPINIHYSSGISMDQEASWVGLGFNINPGTISRSMRGLPDDFNGKDSIVKTFNIKQNKTTGVKLGAQAEIVGLPLTVGAGLGVFHNNYNGWGVEQSLNASLSMSLKSKGDLTSGDSMSAAIGVGLNSNSQSGLSLSPSLNVGIRRKESADNIRNSNFGVSTHYNTRGGISGLTFDVDKSRYSTRIKNNLPGSVSNVVISFAQPAITPTISIPTTSNNYVFHLKTGGELFGFHGNVFVQGYVNKQVIKKEDRTRKMPAFGYLNLSSSSSNPNALLDFNREKEVQFNYKSTPHVAIPQFTYDVYAVSGEGTGGNIRPYRGDAGYIRDHSLRTKSSEDQFSAEIGAGNILHAGFSYDFVRSYTENSEWSTDNSMSSKLKFQESTGFYESVYFRNPGEKTTNSRSYYDQIGDESLIRVQLDRSNARNVKATNRFAAFKNGIKTSESVVANIVKKLERDKRSQVVTYLTAKEADMYALDRSIRSYPENSLVFGTCEDSVEMISRIGDIRQSHHLSEINVLNADGRRYVYGLPAYNVEQQDVTFAVDKNSILNDVDSGLVLYTKGVDNTEHNSKGKDNYFNKEEIPAYAHSFLLTGILSQDYVDIKDDGITEDDLGDAVRFNYTRVYGPGQGYFEWRTPSSKDKGIYNEGFKSYSRDDKASYFFGKKEVWYTHSVESKTMVAFFKISGDRKDAYAVLDQNGGYNTDKSLRKLDSIVLYSKADLAKLGVNAKPVKTVHFEYSYELCKGISGDGEHGKLTLKKIWFSYNGNRKGKLNPYVFNYTGLNPNYHPKKSDRWANYKDPSNNPGSMNNADYPFVGNGFFSVADSSLAAGNSSSWHLSEISQPAGSKMRITYESDDYAFVQNRRAMQFTTVLGFGDSQHSMPVNEIYGSADYDYVFIQSPVAILDKNDIQQKFLEGVDWLYMKLAVTMPTDKWGSGTDFVPVYARIKDWGRVGSSDRFWIQVEKVKGISPLLRSALEFMKNNLSSKAYPTSELGDDIDLADAVKMLLSHTTEIKNAVSGFEKASMQRGWCKQVDLTKSLIRLTAPEYKKLGGGHRVKRIEIFDNWSWMTGQRESVYGQEYQYRTSITVNGSKKVISSGVATYEPMVGNEENPFREPIAYTEKLAPLAPVSYLYTEMPLGESYFPGPSVGYSKVRIRTIHTKAKSANGWEEKEFFTTRDFPTRVEHTLLDQDAKSRYKPKLLSLLRVYSVDRTTVSQGFKVELNDMNGKLKSSSVYAESDSVNPISYAKHYYKVKNAGSANLVLDNNVWIVDSSSGIVNKDGIVGKDIEIINDVRQQKAEMTTGGLSPNLDYFQIGIFPVPLPSFFKFPQFDETLFRSFATVKVIQRYGILDSMVVMDKGSLVSTKNILYDGQTGEVVLSRSNNEFNDPIYSFSYPAHWAYSGMGMAYRNVGATFSNIKVIDGKTYVNGTRVPYQLEGKLESGDELWVEGISQVLMSGENCLDFDPAQAGNGHSIDGRVWAVEVSKGVENDRGIYLIDKYGKGITGILTSVKVVRSGHRNLLSASVGNIVSMVNPVRQISPGVHRLVFDSTSRVISAGVNSYADLWKVDNGLFAKDTVYRVTRTYSEMFSPVVTSRRTIYTRVNHEHETDEIVVYNPLSLVSSYNYIRGGTGCYSRAVRSKNIIQYDLSTIPSNAVVDHAEMSFQPRKPEVVYVQFDNDCSRNFSSYNWTTATNYYIGDSRANLKRITSPWNAFTGYHSFATSAGGQVQLSNSNFSGVSVRDLIQASISSPTYGFMLEMVKNSPSDNSGSEINYLSFCASDSGVTGLSCGGGAAMLGLSAACNCARPLLSVTYTVIEDSLGFVCRPNISDTSINPYRLGILGNWRIDSVFAYFSDRTESNSGSNTNIRFDGTIDKFRPFWSFSDSMLIKNADSTRWVWNSVMNDYNQKGFEVENYDPLGRFNAGVYGYWKSLPKAIAQNSRYQEILSDGFEDYSYNTDKCLTCLPIRDVDFLKNQSSVSIDNAEAHTGFSSLKIDAGNSSLLSSPIISPLLNDRIALHMKVDSTPIYAYNITGKGYGLLANYEGYPNIGGTCGTQYSSHTRIDTTVNFNWGTQSPHPNLCIRQDIPYSPLYVINWFGKVQARRSGYHRFFLDYNGVVGLTVSDGVNSVNLNTTEPMGKAQTGLLYMTAGNLYDIHVTYMRINTSFPRIQLTWKEDINLPEEIVPKAFMYPANMTAADSAGSVQKNLLYHCIKLNPIHGDNLVRPIFKPFQGSKLVVSGWVKLGGADCNTASPLDEVIKVYFDNQDPETAISLQRTGNRIEGWQRYEAVIEVPVNSQTLNLRTDAPSGREIYLDDIRIQPYNSMLKSFVYDPISLRLMAELDENNYASFFEYDDDGTLVRVKKETEKGVMTIKETRSALIKDSEQ